MQIHFLPRCLFSSRINPTLENVFPPAGGIHRVFFKNLKENGIAFRTKRSGRDNSWSNLIFFCSSMCPAQKLRLYII